MAMIYYKHVTRCRMCTCVLRRCMVTRNLLTTLVTSLVITILLVGTCVEIWRWTRIYNIACVRHEEKQTALRYSSCLDPSTVSTRYGGETYVCDTIRNDVNLGPLRMTFERWLHDAWWWPQRPIQRLTHNTWTLLVIAIVSIVCFIAGVFWLISQNRMYAFMERHLQQQHDTVHKTLALTPTRHTHRAVCTPVASTYDDIPIYPPNYLLPGVTPTPTPMGHIPQHVLDATHAHAQRSLSYQRRRVINGPLRFH